MYAFHWRMTLPHFRRFGRAPGWRRAGVLPPVRIGALRLLLVTAMLAIPHAVGAQSFGVGVAVRTALLENSGWDSGTGGQLTGQYRRGTSHIAIRTSAGWLHLGGFRDPVTRNASANVLFTVTAGIEFSPRVWRFEPFGYAALGIAVNRMIASLADISSLRETSTAYGESVGVGLRFLLAGGWHPVDVEVGFSRAGFGRLEFSTANLPGQRYAVEAVQVYAVQAGVRVGL